VRLAPARDGRQLVAARVVALAAFSCVVAACAWASDSTTSRAASFAKRVDIGGGRMMYIECRGSGSPTVLLISGTDTASDLWHAADQKGPTVYDDIQKTTRVCAYDRPGAPHLDQTFSRSNPVPQPTSPQDGVDDLVALLKAADVPGPYVLVAHSFSGTIARAAAAAAVRPMPVVVLTASDKFVDVVPKLIQTGELPPDTPPDFGAVVDQANSGAQNELAALVPGAVRITDTHSGHNIMIENAPVVIQAIRMLVDAVRAGQTSLKG